MKPDERSFRIALMADELVNPLPGGPDGVAAAARAGWGVMQLPAADYPADLSARILAEVAMQAEEFSRHGYDLVVVGECPGLDAALERAGVPPPDRMTPASADDLAAALAARPAPPASSWSWLAADGPPTAGRG